MLYLRNILAQVYVICLSRQIFAKYSPYRQMFRLLALDFNELEFVSFTILFYVHWSYVFCFWKFDNSVETCLCSFVWYSDCCSVVQTKILIDSSCLLRPVKVISEVPEEADSALMLWIRVLQPVYRRKLSGVFQIFISEYSQVIIREGQYIKLLNLKCLLFLPTVPFASF